MICLAPLGVIFLPTAKVILRRRAQWYYIRPLTRAANITRHSRISQQYNTTRRQANITEARSERKRASQGRLRTAEFKRKRERVNCTVRLGVTKARNGFYHTMRSGDYILFSLYKSFCVAFLEKRQYLFVNKIKEKPPARVSPLPRAARNSPLPAL